MKNANNLTIKFFILSVVSAVLSMIMMPAFADEPIVSEKLSTPTLLAVNFANKPPFNRHAKNYNVTHAKNNVDISSIHNNWKPPVKRHLLKKDKLEKVQLAQMGEMTGDIFNSVEYNVSKKIKGLRPPFKRN